MLGFHKQQRATPLVYKLKATASQVRLPILKSLLCFLQTRYHLHLHRHHVRCLRRNSPHINPGDRWRRLICYLRISSKLRQELPLPVVSLPRTMARALLHGPAASRLLPRYRLEGCRASARQIRTRRAPGAQANLGLGQNGRQGDLAEAGLAQSRHVL